MQKQLALSSGDQSSFFVPQVLIREPKLTVNYERIFLIATIKQMTQFNNINCYFKT